MNNEQTPINLEVESKEAQDRREAIKNLGKYAAYVAPFTVMAISAKASATTGTVGKGPAARQASGR